jgi:hypothetical protein
MEFCQIFGRKKAFATYNASNETGAIKRVFRDRLDNRTKSSLLSEASRWAPRFLRVLLFMYGLSKLLHLQFNLQAELSSRPIGSLTGYQLTWYYYGYSRIYVCLLGCTQVAGASLLLFRKTNRLAALLLTPVMANILLINIFILVNDYGPYAISALILAPCS